jgi:predicted  nucleic acid-binding Zn-ribbon protein
MAQTESEPNNSSYQQTVEQLERLIDTAEKKANELSSQAQKCRKQVALLRQQLRAITHPWQLWSKMETNEWLLRASYKKERVCRYTADRLLANGWSEIRIVNAQSHNKSDSSSY